jgi:glycosyltransferase involved in cell wall biosynthesis
MTSPLTPEISVVILCYRSGQYARVFYKQMVDILAKDNLDYEIVLVGNYWPNSGDITPKVVKEIATGNPRTKCVVKEKMDRNQAMGWDMKSGLEIATGKTITVIDGDGQFSPEDIPRLYKNLKEKNLDLCKAVRVSRGDGLYRKFISRVFNLTMRIVFWGIEGDINGKPKLFTRAVYEKLNLESNDWFIEVPHKNW